MGCVFLLKEFFMNEAISIGVYIGLAVLGIIYFILLFSVGKKNATFKKILNIFFSCLVLISIVMILIFLPTESDTDDIYRPLSKSGMYIFSFLLIGLIVALTFIFDTKEEKNPTKALTFAGISVALSFVLSYIRLFSLPQGGAITLVSLLPLCIYSYLFGTKNNLWRLIKRCY